MPRMTTIGARLRRLREDRQWTLDQVAKMVKARESQVSRWELDKATMRLPQLVRFAEVYQVSLDYLVHGRRTNSNG